MTMYTDRKVYLPLAQKLGTGKPLSAHFVRWSVEKDTTGSAAQRSSHFNIYDADADIRAISRIPVDAWDPARPDIGARHGITWITLADLHHDATGNDPIAGVVSVGDVVFLNIMLSSTTKHIERVDAEDLNGTTALTMSVLNHFPTLRDASWADDVTRANRDNADWTAITDKCRVRDLVMVFGGQRYDQKDSGQRLALGVLGLTGSNDDPMRRRRLSGKYLLKAKQGGAVISELQMPHGWRHKRDEDGDVIREGDRGLVPDADPKMAPVLRSLYAAHAEGESYQAIAQRIIEFEAAGQIKRRDHTNRKNTYAASAHSPQSRYDAAKAFFTRSSSVPDEAPTESAIARYLAGEAPEDVFGIDVCMYIAKVELVRTGRYHRRRKNDLRGRGIVLDGIPAVYKDDRDLNGWFDVHSAPWPWPVTEAGEELERFGIPDQTCRQVAVRLLRELRGPKQPTGGRAHRGQTRRALQGFRNWTVPPEDADARYDDEPTEWGIEARANNSGKANFILLFRRESDGRRPRGGLGWSYVGAGEKRSDHIVATGSLDELCGSVAHHLDVAVRDLTEPGQVATLRTVRQPTQYGDPTIAWRTRIELKTAEVDDLENQATGLRAMAARMIAAGADAEADQYAAQAVSVTGDMAAIQREIDQLYAKLATHRTALETHPQDDHADVSIAAYLVAGLQRAAKENGSAAQRLGQTCDDTFHDWRFRVSGEELTWTTTAHIPLASGGQAKLPLSGTIRNVRTRVGKSMATRETVARYLFAEGRDLDSVAALLQVTRKTLLTQRVMPWLVEHGITSRGAKCALVDHPVPAVRRSLHNHVTGAQAAGAPSNGYDRLLVSTYLQSDLAWGDAAVPDDTVWIQAALDLVIEHARTRGTGVPVLDVALALGRSEAEIRALVTPPRRSAGFNRPKYLAYADAGRTRVRLIACPHRSCRRSRRDADHVILLPETAESGYGVLCRRCRRAPSDDATWEAIQFPPAYLISWTKTGEGNLRSHAQTRRVDEESTRVLRPGREADPI